MTDSVGHRGELLRVLGIVFGIAAVVGGSVGQGILRQPGPVAAALHDPVLILAVWLVGGLIVLINAAPVAEVGSALPRTGGPYVFAHRAFGPTTGSVIGWSDWLINLSSQAFMAVVVAEFLQRLGLVALPVAILAPALIVLFFIVNLSHTRICGSTQTLGSALKGFGLVALVALLFLLGGGEARSQSAAIDPAAPALTLGALVIALRAVQNTYDGWNNCIYFSEEMTEPERHVPRSLFGGILLIMILYLSVNAALLYALGTEGMASSKLPAADALATAIGPWAGIAMTLFGILSVGAILNLNVMFGPRILVGMSRDRLLPGALGKVSAVGAPHAALLVGTVIAALLAASGTYEELIAFNVALGFVVNSSVSLAAWRLRVTEPVLPRPWRMPLYPLPIVVAVALNAALLGAMIYEDAFHSLAGIAAATVIGIAAGQISGAVKTRRSVAG